MKLKSLVITIMITLLSLGCTNTLLNEPVDTSKLEKHGVRHAIPLDLGLGGEWEVGFTHTSGCDVTLIIQTLETNWSETFKTWYNADETGLYLWDVSITEGDQRCTEPPYQELWWRLTWLVHSDPINGGIIKATTALFGTIVGAIQYNPQFGEILWLPFVVEYSRASYQDMYNFAGIITLEDDNIVLFEGIQNTRVAANNNFDQED